MEETFLRKIISFLSNNFELFVYVNGSILGLFLLIFIALRLREVSIRKLSYSVLRRSLLMIIILGQVALFMMLFYFYWRNYNLPAPELSFERDVLAGTQWVKDNREIFFIDENRLRSVKINDQDSVDIFTGDDPIKEYHFSPDGKYLLVLTQQDLYLVNRAAKEHRRIDTLTPETLAEGSKESEVFTGSIGGIQWSPDSRRFVYELSRWSKLTVQDNVYVYSLDDQKKRPIRSPTRRISSLYWDRKGENLYYLHHEARDPSVDVAAFEVKVFQIPLSTLTLELITRIPFEKASVPVDNLRSRGIDLFLEGSQLSFGQAGGDNYLISDEGKTLGIDSEDYLFYVSNKWFRRRMFKIPRAVRLSPIPRHQYQGGDLTIKHIRWIPGGRYVIMEHRYWGVLILEPSTRRVGLLVRANGHTFGWYKAVTTE